MLQEYPDAVALCSETTVRQPEMNVWEGILFTETTRGIFFSSDLMFQMGETHGQVAESRWADAIAASGADQLPTPEMQDKLLGDLRTLNPAFVASGHGVCIKIIK